MSFKASTALVVLCLTFVTKAHFTLQFPAAIGEYDDTQLTNGPCDGYDPTTTTSFQDWPWRGEAVTLITTHPVVTWDFNVALFSSVTKSQSSFIPLTESLKQNNGTGYLCFGQVPGKKEWVGQKAIVQIIQKAPDGDLTSCIGVTFTDAPADTTGSGTCKNDSGIAHKPYDIFWLPGTGSDLNTGSTSSSSTSSSVSPTESTSSTASSSTGSETSGPTTTSSSAPTVTDSTSSVASSSGPTTSGTGAGTGAGAGTGTGTGATKSTTSSAVATTSKPATGNSSTDSNKTATTTSIPAAVTGGSAMTFPASVLGFAGLTIFAGLVLGL